jgi:hypothetical protein
MGNAFGACDLSPFTRSEPFNDSFPIQSQSVATETWVSFEFVPIGPRLVKIVRKDKTYLLQLEQKISSEIDAIDQALPKNDCNKYASVSSQSAGATPPTYTIEVTVRGAIWACSPTLKVPCVKLNRSPVLNDSYGIATESAAVEDFDRPTSSTLVQFNPLRPLDQLNPLNPHPSPPGPISPPPEIRKVLPPDPIINPPKMCDGPRIKTKGPGGSVTGRYTLAAVIEGNAPKITTHKKVDTDLDPSAEFVLASLGGLEMSAVTKIGIERLVSPLITKQSDILPREITLPEEPRSKIDLEWTTRTAAFGTGTKDGKPVTEFVVTRDYDTKEGTACSLRATFAN